MRVCMRVDAWVRSYFAEVSKMAQDAARAGATTQSRSTGAGAQETTEKGRNTEKQNLLLAGDLNGKNEKS